MTPCSTLSATFPPFAWAWQQAWVRFCFPQAPRARRLALPNSTIMIHQPLGGYKGQATDMEIHTKYMLDIKARLNRILSDNTGKPLDVVRMTPSVTIS